VSLARVAELDGISEFICFFFVPRCSFLKIEIVSSEVVTRNKEYKSGSQISRVFFFPGFEKVDVTSN
jgi:hypothetical protein